MKRTKKTLLSLLSLTSVILTGCGSQTSEPTSEVEVIWWNNYIKPNNNKTEEENRKDKTFHEYFFAKDVIDAFEKEHPNIKISMEYKGNYKAIADACKAGLGTGNLPTMASTYQDDVATYVENDVAYDMTSLAAGLENDADFNQSFLVIEKDAYQGKCFSLPYSKSGETFVINQSVFDLEGEGKAGFNNNFGYTAPQSIATKEAYVLPENMFEMADIARKMKTDFPEVFSEQKDSQGYFKAVPFCYESGANMLITLFKDAGIAYTDGSGKNASEKYLWNNQQAKDLVIQLKRWNDEGLICTRNQLVKTVNDKHKYAADLFNEGKMFMCVTSTDGPRYFANDGYLASMNHLLNWGTNSKAKDAFVLSQGPSLTFFINRNEKVNEAAFTFYQFLTNKENTAEFSAQTSYFPLRESAYQTEQLKEIVSASNTADVHSSVETKSNDYTGQVFQLNHSYSTNNNYYISDAFDGSSLSRVCIDGLIDEVFNKTVDENNSVEKIVDTAFDNAFRKLTTLA